MNKTASFSVFPGINGERGAHYVLQEERHDQLNLPRRRALLGRRAQRTGRLVSRQIG